MFTLFGILWLDLGWTPRVLGSLTFLCSLNVVNMKFSALLEHSVCDHLGSCLCLGSPLGQVLSIQSVLSCLPKNQPALAQHTGRLGEWEGVLFAVSGSTRSLLRTWHIREGRELITDPDPGAVSNKMGTCVQSQQEKTNAVQDIGHFIGERREDKETWVRNSQVERDYAGEI